MRKFIECLRTWEARKWDLPIFGLRKPEVTMAEFFRLSSPLQLPDLGDLGPGRGSYRRPAAEPGPKAAWS